MSGGPPPPQPPPPAAVSAPVVTPAAPAASPAGSASGNKARSLAVGGSIAPINNGAVNPIFGGTILGSGVGASTLGGK